MRALEAMRSLLCRSSSTASSSSAASTISSKDSRKNWTNGSCDQIHVYLNVYDLTPMNNYLYWLGLGVFHSGIEVHGKEFGFGAHEFPTSGVFEVEPRSCPGFIYRRSLFLGSTDMSHVEFRSFLESLSDQYRGDTYHLVAKNCNHFTDDVCMHLTGRSIPGWVNRLARLGSLFNCILPENIRVTAVHHLPDHITLSDGSESIASSFEDSDEENSDHRLLGPLNSESARSPV